MASDMPTGANPEQPEPEAPAAPGTSGQPPADTPPAPQAPAWTTPPPPSTGDQSSGSWGSPPAAQPQGQWGSAPQPTAPQQPAGWGGQPQAPQQPAQPQGQWGGAPAAAPGTWSASAPPPQAQAPQPGWGAPGQPQPGWQGGPPPAQSSGNGCLKACLIVGVVLVVLAIIVSILLAVAGFSFFGGLGIDSSGNLKDCPIVSSAQLQTVLGPDTQAAPLSGLANSTIGAALDKRVLPNADNCWVGSGTSTDTTQPSGAFGRIAKYSGGDASSVFDQERSNAQSGGYFATDVPGAGDQAFCTGWSDYPATGALVRKGNDLVYVSFLLGDNLNFDESSGEAGIPYSPQACSDAVQIAQLALR